jgi:hypothetical protein
MTGEPQLSELLRKQAGENAEKIIEIINAMQKAGKPPAEIEQAVVGELNDYVSNLMDIIVKRNIPKVI